MKISSLLLIIIILSAQHLFSQEHFNKKVAVAGNKEISAEEFLQRYEFTPFTGKHIKRGLEQNKLNFLYTLVAEKLWALEAERNGFDTTEVIRFSLEQFRKMFVRDALFNREIRNKVEITEDEITEGLHRHKTKLFVRFLYSEEEEEINALHNLLLKGVDFDSILVERFEYEEQLTPVEVVYGQMDFSVEDSLYNLDPGSFTTPVLTPEGWYIFMLVNWSQSLMRTSEDDILNVKKILTARKVSEYYDSFFIEFFSDKKVDVNARLAKLLSENIKVILEEKYSLRGVENDNLISIGAAEVLKLEEIISPEDLSGIYMEVEGKPMTLRYFIRLLAFDGFNIKPAELRFIPSIIFERNRNVIEKELLADYAMKKNYHQLPEVSNDIEMWKNNYLFQIMRNQFADSISVSEEEAIAYYKERHKEADFPPLVNIIEVYSDSMVILEDIIDSLKKGTDIRDLALLYSKRDLTKRNKGESGLVSIYQLGEIGQIAYNMEPGETYGPVLINNGFSIFKLIEKRVESTEKPESFESIKDEIYQKLTSQKLRGKLQRYTVHLADKYGFDVDEQALVDIKVTNINSIAFRNLGFGGKITAVPLVAPDFNWVYEYFEKIYLP
jgi:hypothetical protein